MKSTGTLIFSLTFIIQILQSYGRSTVKSVDFVIIGAGTAGCALAGRLCTSLPNATIVLLERGEPRGKDSEFIVRAPRNTILTFTVPELVETYESKPSKGLLGRRSNIVTGKTLGGSSSVNGMQWTVPVGGAIDKWGITGLTSGNWKKYLRRAYREVNFGVPPKSLRQIYTNDYIQAAVRAGFPEDDDVFADKTRDAIWLNRLAIDDHARRVDSCTAYVKPVAGNICSKNLEIIQSATATKILLDQQRPPKAYGVEFVTAGNANSKSEKHIIHTKKEVLLSAGPYESPKLLQLSGIGPWQVLLNAGVPKRVDLAVGTRSQARVLLNLVSNSFSVPPDPASNEILVNSPEERRNWENGKGGLLGVAQSAINGLMKRRGYFTAAYRASSMGSGLGLFSFCQVNPRSYGYVRIRSNDPFSAPSVKLNLLGRKSDMKKAIFCMKRLRDIHNAIDERFKLTEVFPGAAGVTEAFVRNSSQYSWHFVGGCGVGRVVDGSLTVNGVRGLRVVDSSVFRSMPESAGPLAVTYMLAEFMAEKIWRIYR